MKILLFLDCVRALDIKGVFNDNFERNICCRNVLHNLIEQISYTYNVVETN